ncbi:MAG TPA: hypothetical protein VN039_10550 [Nitrospira sp.]|nr:hypothetical protein [Nitrospira sp.]
MKKELLLSAVAEMLPSDILCKRIVVQYYSEQPGDYGELRKRISKIQDSCDLSKNKIDVSYDFKNCVVTLEITP